MVTLFQWATKVHQTDTMETGLLLVPFSYLLHSIYCFLDHERALEYYPRAVGRLWILVCFIFPFFIQLLQQRLVKKVESGTDILNIYLEEVGIRKGT